MNKKFIKLFICPKCKLNKLDVNFEILKIKKVKKLENIEILRCKKGHVFRINNGIPNFVINNKLESKIYDDVWKNNTLSKYKKKDIKLYKKKLQSFANIKKLNLLLQEANIKNQKAESFKRYGSAKKLYNFKIDNISNY